MIRKPSDFADTATKRIVTPSPKRLPPKRDDTITITCPMCDRSVIISIEYKFCPMCGGHLLSIGETTDDVFDDIAKSLRSINSALRRYLALRARGK